MDDDPYMLMYQMVGSDKLFSDIEFPIQNVIVEKFKRVFKLVEIEISDVENLAAEARNLKEEIFFITNQETRSIKRNFLKMNEPV
ncbi:hypothetical protein HanHA300_Chr14g0510861 [Helianthus annuus]|nr:hypothetical protein HanHA300_Chr14g0510861 [Helianthus annuus]